MAKVAKRTKKFVKNKLDQTLQQRRDYKKRNLHVRDRQNKRDSRSTSAAQDGNDDEEPLEDAQKESSTMGVDEFLQGGFEAGMGSESEEQDSAGEGDDDLEDMEDITDDEDGHAEDLEKLKEKDPEFYKYLQENDRDLLAFGHNDEPQQAPDESDTDDEQDEEEEEAIPVVTTEMLKQWQQALLRHHSLRALRRLLLAFRSAVHTGDEEGDYAYRIEDGPIFAKVLITTLKYTPKVIQHHVPYKSTADGHFKVPTHTKKWSSLVRPIRSYFLSVIQLLKTHPEPDMVYTALTESAKMIPYMHQDRRVARDYVKQLLHHWSSGQDKVRLAAFSCLYVTTSSASDEMIDFCLKSAYHTLVRSTKQTTPHTMPNIVLMKNTACELFCLHPDAAYQQTFGFIRQLAISLRNCLKLKSKEQFQAVLNWPYIHCLDFWSMVLSKTCNDQSEEHEPSHMRPLIYPLVQVALGVARLVPISRYFPLRMHVVRGMLRLIQTTHVYIPLAALILEVFESPEFQRKSKGATLKPLDLETTFRAPQAYVRTRIYAEQLADEFSFLLQEYLSTQARSIAFPELVIPITVQMRRVVKTGQSSRLTETLRALLEKCQQNAVWIEQRRQQIEFAPNDHRQVDRFLENESSEAPMEASLRLARKVRAQKQKLLEQNAYVVGDDEE
ncbi:Nucleolar Complex 2 protein [Malassezia yamatoensis]|uniref:Nucleolar Complex 2 protein n=1 Tax=Malassezia yamatoensis TaxID=253288 RepID=A0AAJ6CHI6_9BASI|nr:Nucleolar Complex 2 protein [Malassezia yamatoensis]